MKTTRFVLVLTFVAFATMIFAQADRPNQTEPAPNQLCVKISLERALMDRGLVTAMHQQIKPALLIPDKVVYVAKVRYNRTVYYIFGPYEGWKAFFKTDKAPDVIPDA